MDFTPLLPEIILSLSIVFYFIVGFFLRDRKSHSLFVCLISLLVLFSIPFSEGALFKGFFIADTLSQSLKFIFVITLLYVVIFSYDYSLVKDSLYFEYVILLMLSVLGMMFVVSSRELMSLFLAMEFMSLCLYLLAGIVFTDVRSNEAALKYFLLGSMASVFFLLGMAIIYGQTATTYYAQVMGFLEKMSGNQYYLVCGILALILALAFKAGLAPFHQWSPDVYEGAPTPITAFFSVAPKAAALGALMRLSLEALYPVKYLYQPVLILIALLTILIGNILALRQVNMKRLLAYSSIAHAGYVLLAIIAFKESGLKALLFYFWVYAFMNLGAFAVVLAHPKGEDLEEYRGFYKVNQFLAFTMLAFLFSLAGIPPFGGFVAKYLVFQSLVEAGLIWVAVIAIVFSIPSVYYYLRIGIKMFFIEREEIFYLTSNVQMKLIVILSVLGTILTGLWPYLVFLFF
ncbi:MAG: NADH-quinone oxidoreductase subunit N [Caldimicrobium sp.]|nr:NADH-quinone oxidoreductase subunit N [Caldimicrobium sp.]MCX7873393.1 NADH-quinone oxidoreductase subunit N [Caldimicrobium sp.]MDW8094371.1 NADH-quinone oxidoreductase subunit N [Caldimicrobium sp.]